MSITKAIHNNNSDSFWVILKNDKEIIKDINKTKPLIFKDFILANKYSEYLSKLSKSDLYKVLPYSTYNDYNLTNSFI